MLSQFDNEHHKNRIRRSKSTTSVKERRKHPIISEPLDPESARVHAVIAAHRAMDRSRGSSEADLYRSDSSASKQSARLARGRHAANQSDPATRLQRQRSLLQATTPNLAATLPLPGGGNTARGGPQSSTHTSVSEFGGSYEGEPSSYRRLRKANKTLRHDTNAANLDGPGLKLRLKKSFDVLKFTRRRATSPEKPPHNSPYRPESVELARTQFLQSHSSPQPLDGSPDVLYNGQRRQKKDFRSSLRSSDSAEPKELQVPKHSALTAARSISSSLRNRFKRAFSKPDSCLPPQQLDAARAHFGDATFGDIGNGGFDSYLTEENHELRRGSLYDDPWHEKVDDEDLRKLATMAPVNKSNESLSASSKSRVTSWTNTTTTGSMRETPLERKRLSVIQEDGGPHQPSSSAGTHLGSVSVFRKPLPLPPGQQPNPQRLYSALVRRMNQESVDRASIAEEEDEESHSSAARIPERTIRAVTSSTAAGPYTEHETAEDDAVGGHQVPSNVADAVREAFRYNHSEESVYSRRDNGAPNPDYQHCVNISEQDIGARDMPLFGKDINMYRLANKSNPYASDLTFDDALRSNNHTGGSVDSSRLETSRGITHVRQKSVREVQYRVMPTPEINQSQASFKSESEISKAPSHVREQAQINSDQTTPVPSKFANDPISKALNHIVKSSGDNDRNDSRTPTPSEAVPDQLSVAKKRFPLLNVKQVSKNNTPIPSRNSSLTRSQSGLLQQMADAERQQNSKHENKLATSLRKISPENVANLLKGKKSLAVLSHKKLEKENRPISGENTPETKVDEAHAASTPGPSYLAMRSGNSAGQLMKQKETNNHSESPTDLVKATLSARLSRPFDMDTPNLNRPFDSMYLGKREIGHQDTTGGRLSVAQAQQAQNHVLGYDKRRSFERGPGGYGGLGPSPFDGQTPVKQEEETALPHFPTPEDQLKHKSSKMGMSLGSKRMVSNFLRSRRKAVSSEEGAAVHEEDVQGETPGKDSPLYV
ncbi:hypothetical protein OHC33_009588 [Knufia fluminis]|uniref:Uncharacterized protein n=1 Tax=Knufia fluminis TaxID=191047 RepID=A0AAN8I454_9EURO|nr:hypothetical protein OHC33_009588 [Knufia fluminis]